MEGMENAVAVETAPEVSNESATNENQEQINEGQDPNNTSPNNNNASTSNDSMDNEGQSGDSKKPVHKEDTDKGRDSKEANKDMHKIKVYGEEREVSLDELKKLASKAGGADQAFKEAAQLKKDVGHLVKTLKENPIEVFKQMGVDFKEIAESYLMKELELEAMPEAERKNLEYEEQLKKYKEQEELIRKQQEQQRFKQEAEQHKTHFEKLINDSVAESGLPKSPAVMRRIMGYMQNILQHNENANITPQIMQQINNKVRQDLLAEQRQLYGNLEADKLAELLGEDITKKINKHYVGKFNNSKKSRQQSQDSDNISNSSRAKLSKDEWRARLNKIMSEG